MDGNLYLKPIVHEIRIQNQVIFLDPPIESAREIWVKQLHEWLGEHVFPIKRYWINVLPKVWFVDNGACKVRDTRLVFRCKALGV